VVASLYPIVTVLLAAALLRERIAPLQRAGVALTLTGVVLIGF
jgi:drug/metabolite transporter (DMT)-like permease